MASALNCSQFTVPFPEPGTDEAGNYTIPWLIDTLVLAYRPYHYYLLTSIVIFSFFTNILIVIVLSHKEMRHSGVNVTMLIISICDVACALAGLVQLYLRNYSVGYSSYLTAYIQITVDYLYSAFHAASLYLAIGMAFCRVMSLKASNQNRDQWQSPVYALRMAAAMCTFAFTFRINNIFLNGVKETEKDGIYMEVTDLAIANGCLYLKISVVSNAVISKLVPCLSMILLSIMILKRMAQARRSAVQSRTNNEDKIERSSRFIKVILGVFVLCEAPQGIYLVIGGFVIVDHLNYIQRLSIFMNILAYVNTTTTFIIYSSLSGKFRKLFFQIFLPRYVAEKIYKGRSTLVVQSVAHSSQAV